MATVSIGGKNLHEIRMRLKGGRYESISYLLYPKHRIKAEVKNKKIILHIPPLLAVALFESVFRDSKEFPVSINKKERGLFRLTGITYPDQIYDDGLVDITMEAVNELAERLKKTSWKEQERPGHGKKEPFPPEGLSPS